MAAPADVSAALARARRPEHVAATSPPTPIRQGSAAPGLGGFGAFVEFGDTSPAFHVLPVGLFYDDKTRFRSRVSASIGEPIDPYEWAEDYAERGHDAAVDFTGLLEKRLAELVLEADSVELYSTLVSVAKWTSDDPDFAVDAAHERARTLARAYERMVGEDPTSASELAEDVVHFRRMVESIGVDDPMELEPPRLTVGNITRATAPLIAGAPLALLGAVASWVPYRLLAPISRHIAGSETDIISSVKALLGLFVLPTLYVLEAVAIGSFFGAGWGIAAAVALPLCGYIALRWGELFDLRREVLKGHWLRVTRSELVEEVVGRRRELSQRISESLRKYDHA